MLDNGLHLPSVHKLTSLRTVRQSRFGISIVISLPLSFDEFLNFCSLYKGRTGVFS